MPARAPTPCRQRGCANLCRDKTGYCKDHKAPSGWNDPTRGNNIQRGYGYAWRKLRNSIMHRDKELCQECLKAMEFTQATEVDHITPKNQGGTDEPENLQALCSQCHAAKTIRERGTDAKAAQNAT